MAYSNKTDGRRGSRTTRVGRRSLPLPARERAMARFTCKSPVYSARRPFARFRALRAVRHPRAPSRYRAVLREGGSCDRNSAISRSFVAITLLRATRCRWFVWRALPRSANFGCRRFSEVRPYRGITVRRRVDRQAGLLAAANPAGARRPGPGSSRAGRRRAPGLLRPCGPRGRSPPRARAPRSSCTRPAAPPYR